MTNGDFILILTKDDQKWTPPNPSLLVRVFENVFKRCLLHDLIDIHMEFNERELLLIRNYMDSNEESVYIKQMRCG